MNDPVESESWWNDLQEYRKRLSRGHRYSSPAAAAVDAAADTAATPCSGGSSWTAKAGSHDDGDRCGLFLGGIGTPVMSRDLDGLFARWHMQNGYHLRQVLEEAFFSLRWAEEGTEDSSRGGYLRLADSPGQEYRREVLSLFPVTREQYQGEGLPLVVIAEFFSPLLPEDHLLPWGSSSSGGPPIPLAALPVFISTVTVRNRSAAPLSVDAACVWPNLLGWKAPQATSLDQPERSWPGQTHAGNSAFACCDGQGVAAVQTRHAGRPVMDELMGQVAIFSPAPQKDHQALVASRASVEACCKARGNKIDRPPHDQGHTLAWMEDHFRRYGVFPESGLTWTAHWDEALCSGVSRGGRIGPGESLRISFVLAFDMPIIRFGNGRRWYRKYTASFGRRGTSALEIARIAADSIDAWRRDLDEWHQRVLATRAEEPDLAGAMLNELYFINGGGSVWTESWAEDLDSDLPEPLLGAGEHGAILEGYDVGYYYYNTSDLWPYAWYGLWRWWPGFAGSVFSDLLKSVPLKIPRKQMIYRSETMEPLMVAGKVPHDIGAVMEDPWHSLNGYQMRDDSNLWKDHNPAFLLSLYLERRFSGHRLSLSEWAAVREAGLFMLDQAEESTSLPLHRAFGDSTWDNLGLQGYVSYSAGFTLGALAALVVWAGDFGDGELARQCRQRLKRAGEAFETHLWNGEYYRLCDQGGYRDCLMGDGVLGIFLADLAGLHPSRGAIPREQVKSHLKSVYRYCFLQYQQGKVGPLLVAAPGRTRFSGDGGDELQVNEVLLGSAWSIVAMMEYYGLDHEAREIASVLVERIYGTNQHGRGLQFRTPAAIDGSLRFRAPLNMRPLSIWLLDAVSQARATPDH